MVRAEVGFLRGDEISHRLNPLTFFERSISQPQRKRLQGWVRNDYRQLGGTVCNQESPLMRLGAGNRARNLRTYCVYTRRRRAAGIALD